jgi:hypothetical protein
VPPLGALPPGCSFITRCPDRFEPCPTAHPGDTVFVLPPEGSVLPPEGGSHEANQVTGGFRRQAEERTVKCYLHGPAVEPAEVSR